MRPVVLCLILLSFQSLSQNKGKEVSDFVIHGNVSIPNPVSSEMYRTAFDGIYEANFAVSKKVAEYFLIGVGYQSVLFQNDERFKYAYFNASIPYNTRLQDHGFFFRFTYARYASAKIYLDYSANMGYSVLNYYNINADTSASNQPYGAEKFNAAFFQPEFSLNFLVENNLSFSINLSYTTLFSHFDPRAPRFNQFEEIAGASNKYFMSWINFGFGFNVLLNGKKK